MAVRNCEETLLEALDSIRNQTYENWELIVCNDASTDGTGEVLARYAAELGPARMTVLSNDENRKLAFSLNRCLEVASGDFVARMDGDDRSELDRFEKQVRFLLSNPKVDLVGTAMRRFDSDGPGEVVHPASNEPDRWTMGETTKVPFFHATILAKAAVFAAVGNYTVSWRTERGQDVDLWFKFFAAGLIGRNLRDPLYNVRENSLAVRRRTPRARLGGVVTRVKGNWRLGYPPRAYAPSIVGLLKILVPYWVFDLHRALTKRRSRDGFTGQESEQ